MAAWFWLEWKMVLLPVYGIVCVSIWALRAVCVLSSILSDAYSFRVSNSVLVSTFFALAKISRQISLKTKSAQLVLASSISSLQALSNMLFILLTEVIRRGFFGVNGCDFVICI